MQHSSTSAGRGSRGGLARIYGARLFYQPKVRRQVAFFAAGLSVVAYIIQGAVQVVTLPSQDLKWDWVQFRDAAVSMAGGHDPYAGFLSLCPGNRWCQGGYIFPPLLAEVLRPFAALPTATGGIIWLLISHLLMAAAIVVTWRAVRDLVSPTAGAVLLAATLGFLPLYVSLFFLQVGVLLLLLLALAAAAQMRGAPRAEAGAGVWLGVAAVLRVSPILLAPSLLWAAGARGRRRLHWVGLAAMGTTGVGLLALLYVLTPFTRTYFTQVLPRISGGTSFLDNLSLAGVVLRGYDFYAPGAEAPVALIGAACAAVALVPPWILWQRALRGSANPRATRALGFAAFLAALPIASSITWQHHLLLEMLVYALLAPSLVVAARPGAGARGRGLALGLALVAYPLMWADRHVTDQVVIWLGLAQPTGWRVVPFLVLTATNLVGMVCLWGACLVALGQSAAEPVDAHAVTAVHQPQLGGA